MTTDVDQVHVNMKFILVQILTRYSVHRKTSDSIGLLLAGRDGMVPRSIFV